MSDGFGQIIVIPPKPQKAPGGDVGKLRAAIGVLEERREILLEAVKAVRKEIREWQGFIDAHLDYAEALAAWVEGDQEGEKPDKPPYEPHALRLGIEQKQRTIEALAHMRTQVLRQIHQHEAWIEDHARYEQDMKAWQKARADAGVRDGGP
jgi:hypothetical protein